MTTNSTTIERERALAWIAEQLRWERTLDQLRARYERAPGPDAEREDERRAA